MYEVELRTVLHTELFVLGALADGQFGVTAEVGEPGFAFETFPPRMLGQKLPLGQIVDEMGCVFRHFVFIVIGIAVVHFH